MRTLVIGDMHGCFNALVTLLDLVQPNSEDRLITLGDYVDRGPQSREVLDQLIDLYTAGQLIPLRGNHDEMMWLSRYHREERRLWLRFGGVQTLESYGHHPSEVEYSRVPERHWDFLEHNLLDFYETERHLFAHASILPDVPLAEQGREVLLWKRLIGPVAHCSGKTLICGHTRQDTGYPLDLGTVICIDTAIYEEHGWLTCLDVESGTFWQANQVGEKRVSSLEHLPQLRASL
ncbi:MAG: metallophosphoesterase family protein [Gemmataceae bacterium]